MPDHLLGVVPDAVGVVVLVVVLLVVCLAWHLTYTAARLDRLHTRAEGALSALDGQLVRRSETAFGLAGSGLLDPASSLALAEAASACLDAAPFVGDTLDESGVLGPGSAERTVLENELSARLRDALDPVVVDELRGHPDGRDHVERLGAVGLRVQLARRFHADAVDDVLRVRRKELVRLFHLAGHAALPEPVDLDDRLPEGVGPAPRMGR